MIQFIIQKLLGIMGIYKPPEMLAVTDIKGVNQTFIRVPRGAIVRQYGLHKSIVFISFLGCIDESVFPDKFVLSQGY